jgi:hypothetical protein
MLKNVKIRWISMLEHAKRVMGEFRILVVKMDMDGDALPSHGVRPS